MLDEDGKESNSTTTQANAWIPDSDNSFRSKQVTNAVHTIFGSTTSVETLAGLTITEVLDSRVSKIRKKGGSKLVDKLRRGNAEPKSGVESRDPYVHPDWR